MYILRTCSKKRGARPKSKKISNERVFLSVIQRNATIFKKSFLTEEGEAGGGLVPILHKVFLKVGYCTIHKHP
jgi:hypothetical protein